MKVLTHLNARSAEDGDGVKIRRITDYQQLRLDPFLMLDELKSDDKNDYIGGFPPHPHRGIETFTYIRKGGFEHRDHLGNREAIRAGEVQWMSTGSGVLHSEMPLADSEQGLHGFQLWLNMPAVEKMRPAIYQDTKQHEIPTLALSSANVSVLAGTWRFFGEVITAPIANLAGNAAIADLVIAKNAAIEIELANADVLLAYIYQGEVGEYQQGQLLLLDSGVGHKILAGKKGAGVLLLKGNPINEKIVQYGPFVMNSEEQIKQAIDDYQRGKFGTIG